MRLLERSAERSQAVLSVASSGFAFAASALFTIASPLVWTDAAVAQVVGTLAVAVIVASLGSGFASPVVPRIAARRAVHGRNERVRVDDGLRTLLVTSLVSSFMLATIVGVSHVIAFGGHGAFLLVIPLSVNWTVQILWTGMLGAAYRNDGIAYGNAAYLLVLATGLLFHNLAGPILVLVLATTAKCFVLLASSRRLLPFAYAGRFPSHRWSWGPLLLTAAIGLLMYRGEVFVANIRLPDSAAAGYGLAAELGLILMSVPAAQFGNLIGQLTRLADAEGASAAADLAATVVYWSSLLGTSLALATAGMAHVALPESHPIATMPFAWLALLLTSSAYWVVVARMSSLLQSLGQYSRLGRPSGIAIAVFGIVQLTFGRSATSVAIGGLLSAISFAGLLTVDAISICKPSAGSVRRLMIALGAPVLAGVAMATLGWAAGSIASAGVLVASVALARSTQ